MTHVESTADASSAAAVVADLDREIGEIDAAVQPG